jgi:hypothetical protein
MKEALAWTLGLTAAAAAGAGVAYALSGGGSTPAPTTAKATPPPPTATPTPTPTPTPVATPAPAPTPAPVAAPVTLPIPVGVINLTPPVPSSPTPSVLTPFPGGHPTIPIPKEPNTSSITISPGTITAPSVGPTGSTLLIYVNPTGSVENQFSGADPIVDGVQTTSVKVGDGIPLTPAAGSSVWSQSGDVVAVQTTRDNGTIIVSWIDSTSTLQTTYINYGTPPQYPGMTTVQIPANGNTQAVTGVGFTGSKIIISPPTGSDAILSPVVVDGQQIDLQSVNNGVSVTVTTTLWSGVLEIYWTTDLQPSAPGAPPVNAANPPPPPPPVTPSAPGAPPAPTPIVQSNIKTLIYYGT